MKLIETYKSPNFNNRGNKTSVRYIILHYTAMTNHLDSIKHMCSANNKVSTHAGLHIIALLFNRF